MTDEAASARAEVLRELRRAAHLSQQRTLRESLKDQPDYLDAMISVYLQNPFLKLSDEEVRQLNVRFARDPVAALISARHAATRAPAKNYGVFSMPKSGSTFLKSALDEALEVRFVSLTGFGAGELSSHFGMNSREQELDEMALVKAALMSPQGFVAQHHTRYTQYLGLQLRAYGVKPIVGVRNILDVLVSFDDMMMQGREKMEAAVANDPHNWVADTQFALPRGYAELDPDTRFRVIGPSLGIWLIQFRLSWIRGERQSVVKPLVVRYEEDVLDPPRLTAKLTEALQLDADQAQRLAAFAEKPDPSRARFNVGRAGRGGERVPEDVRRQLLDYAGLFRQEIPQEEIDYLLG